MERKNKNYDAFREAYGKAAKTQIKEILHIEEPLTVKAVAVRMGVSYHTARIRLNELLSEGSIISHSIDGKTKVFFLKAFPEVRRKEKGDE